MNERYQDGNQAYRPTRRAVWYVLMAVLAAISLALPALAQEQGAKGPTWEQSNNGSGHGTISSELDSEQPQPAEPVPTGTPEIGRSTGMTLMVYLCGSNLESSPGSSQNSYCASRDLVEIAQSGFDETAVNVIVMAGGADQWGIDAIPARTTGLYQIGNNSISVLANDGNAYNMASPATLSMLLQFAYEQFPAEKYALILWDHGGGSLHGICSDINYSPDTLSMQELDQALRESPFAERKLSWIGFDACLMASAEVARIVAPYAEYMIASEETEPGWGWNYSFVGALNKDESAEQTGKRIIEEYFAVGSQSNAAQRTNLTMACIDLSKIDDVIKAVDDFFDDIVVNQNSFASISRVRRTLVGFGRSEDRPNNDYDLVDLGEIAQHFGPFGGDEKALRLAESVSSCVVANRAGEEACTGLSIYHPYYNREAFPYSMNMYSSLGFSDSYTSFVNEFGRYLISNGSGNWGNLSPLLSEQQKDNRTLVSLRLNESQMAEIGMANILAVAQSASGEGWHLVATQEAAISDEGVVSGEYVHTNLFVTDADGRPMFGVPMLSTQRDNGAYLVNVALVDEGGVRTDAQLLCSRDRATDLVAVDAVYLYDETIGGYSPRLSGSLEDYVTAIFRVEERTMVSDENGTIPDFSLWPVVAENEYAWSLSEPWQLAFVRDSLDVDTLRVGFKLTDVFNNVYMSTLIAIGSTPDAAFSGFIVTYDDDLILAEDISLNPTADGSALRLSARLTNRTDAEAIIAVEHVVINGQETNVGAEIYGNGDNDGLLPGESQPLMLRLPLQAGGSQTEITFDLVLLDADGAATGVVPVHILVSAH